MEHAHLDPVTATSVPLDINDCVIPGAFQIEVDARGLFYICPCGCGDLGFLGFRGKSDPERPSWIWDGNVERPTLQPSIRRTAHCKFHGHLTNGVWTFEGDSGV